MSTAEPGPAGGDAPLILVMGTADWSAPIATNQHYVVRELARGHDCLFTEGVGTRRLRINRDDARRVLRRLRPRMHDRGTSRPVPDRVEVLSPRLLPFRSGPARRVNRRLLTTSVQRWLAHPGPRVLWTYTPYTYGLELRATRTVYHLVDLLHENPDVDPAGLRAAERVLAATADVAMATSPAVADHLRDSGFRRVLERGNVADTGLFEAAAGAVPTSSPPVVVFTGALAPHKVDFALIHRLAGRLQGTARVRLIGPPAPSVPGEPTLADLVAAGVEVCAPLPLERLSREVAAATVGVVPYRLTGLTRGVSPLKLYEFLAAGLPVVTTALPSVQPVGDCIWVEPDAAGFVERVARLVSCPDAAGRAARQALAREHDWSARGEELRALVDSLLSTSSRPREAVA